jgi:hypothetical protein
MPQTMTVLFQRKRHHGLAERFFLEAPYDAVTRCAHADLYTVPSHTATMLRTYAVRSYVSYDWYNSVVWWK